MAEINTVVADVIATVEKRSAVTRRNYLDGVAMMEADPDSNRGMLGCSNLAHAAAGALDDQTDLLDGRKPHSFRSRARKPAALSWKPWKPASSRTLAE